MDTRPVDPRERLRAAADGLTAAAEDLSVTRDRLEQIRTELAWVERELFGPRPRSRRGEGARVKILAYMMEHVGQSLPGEALRELTAIQEWARRVRELRVEEGYDIIERDGTYTLVSVEPDLAAAARWEIASRIRRSPGSGQQRILKYLKANVGQVLTSAELIYVARINSAPRKARELRDELGYRISTSKTHPDLRADQFLLETTEPLHPSERRIKPRLRDAVFIRDGFKCQNCGAVPGPGVWLEIDLIREEPIDSSDDDADNLQTLCNRCHAEKTGDASGTP